MVDTLLLPPKTEKSSTQTEDEFAEEMRAMGFRKVVRWVPDMTNPEVRAEYQRQRALVAAHQRSHRDELIELTEEDVMGWT